MFSVFPATGFHGDSRRPARTVWCESIDRGARCLCGKIVSSPRFPFRHGRVRRAVVTVHLRRVLEVSVQQRELFIFLGLAIVVVVGVVVARMVMMMMSNQFGQ